MGLDPPVVQGLVSVDHYYLKYDERLGSEWNANAVNCAIEFVRERRPELWDDWDEKAMRRKIREHIKWVHRREKRKRRADWAEVPYLRGRAKYTRKYNVSTSLLRRLL